MPAVAPDRGYEIETGRVNEPGLDAVNPFDSAEQMIVIGNLVTVPRERSRREIAIVARKALLNGASEHGLVARAGHLLVIGQAGRVAINGLAHAECARLLGHDLREGLFI